MAGGTDGAFSTSADLAFSVSYEKAWRSSVVLDWMSSDSRFSGMDLGPASSLACTTDMWRGGNCSGDVTVGSRSLCCFHRVEVPSSTLAPKGEHSDPCDRAGNTSGKVSAEEGEVPYTAEKKALARRRGSRRHRAISP